MTARRLILHVGPHKTGSTALQHALLNTRDALAEQGFDYPLTGIQQFAHHQLYGVFAGEARAVAELPVAKLLTDLDHGRDVILSSENFIYLGERRLAELRDHLAGFRVEVVIFIRSPVELWPSHWQELVKHGRAETLIEYMAAYLGWNSVIDASIMNPVVQGNRFSRVFGREALRMFSYDNIVDNDEDIYDMFWRSVLRIEAPPPARERRVLNPSLEPVMTEMLRCLNEQHLQSGARPSDFVLSRYLKVLAEVEASPEYAEFREAFEGSAATLHLESAQELFRNRERMLMNSFGACIENKAAGDRLNTREVFKRNFVYARRYWADRAGLAGWVGRVLARLGEI
jgi:hypothetical protein